MPPKKNTPQTYGSVARFFHWLTALLILTAIAVVLYTHRQPARTEPEVMRVALLFSLHKTVGIAAFFTALLRILWAFGQPKPGPIHPERRLETFVGDAVHWSLYAAMVIMPLSGWLGHAARPGLSPIWWPFAQTLPFVPASNALGRVFFTIHGFASKALYASIALHVAGALKHALIDRDGTMARMIDGRRVPVPPSPRRRLPAIAALAAWAGLVVVGVILGQPKSAPAMVTTAPAPTTGGNWAVSDGTLGFTVKQMQATVTGVFTGWTADITYDETAKTGAVTVSIPLSGLTVGSITQQVAGPEFLDIAAHPSAIFQGTIAETGGQLAATGMLDLHGKRVPVTLPFTLAIAGDTARMTGELRLDRRDFGIGGHYPDEQTVGFGVTVDVALTARRR